MGTRIVVVADEEGGAAEAATRLARVGIDSTEGYLEGGIYAWDTAGMDLGRMPQMPVDELCARLGEAAAPRVIDVRRAAEFGAGHIARARNVPLAELPATAPRLDPAGPTALICGSGYRSSIAASLLGRMGFSGLYNVVGGQTAWESAYPVERETPSPGPRSGSGNRPTDSPRP
jgi:hydroxyacylglutathione hydrolase